MNFQLLSDEYQITKIKFRGWRENSKINKRKKINRKNKNKTGKRKPNIGK
jgi:hypothetical protein